MTETSRRSEHNTVKLPESLTDEMDKYLGTKGFTSRAEIAKQAIREFMERNPLPKQQTNLPRFEHFNMDANGVKITDLSTRRIANIFFKPTGIYCDICHTNNCEHIQFALTVPKIQKIILERKKDGWNLPDI